MLTPWTKAPSSTLTYKMAIYAVTHASKESLVVKARVIQLTVITMETRLTPTHIISIGQVSTDTIVLARRRGTWVKAGTVLSIVTIIAVTVVLYISDVPALSSILTGSPDTGVKVLTQLTKESPMTFTVELCG